MEKWREILSKIKLMEYSKSERNKYRKGKKDKKHEKDEFKRNGVKIATTKEPKTKKIILTERRNDH